MNTNTEILNSEEQPKGKRIVLAGSASTGKDSIFYALTGLSQRFCKINSVTQGKCIYGSTNYMIMNLPDISSLTEVSSKERSVRDIICFGSVDTAIVVCNAASLEHNLSLVLQILEITPNVVVCINFIEKAKKKHIEVNCTQMQKCLGVPVEAVNARNSKNLTRLMEQVPASAGREKRLRPSPVHYVRPIEKAIFMLEPSVKKQFENKLNSRFMALRLIDYDEALIAAIGQYFNYDILSDAEICTKIAEARNYLANCGISGDILHDNITSCITLTAEGICSKCII